MTSSITISHTAADGTIVEGDTRPYKDTIKAHGLRWSRPQGFWYVRGSRDKLPDTRLIDRLAQALREAGAEMNIEVDETLRPVAEVEATRAERAEDRADALADKAGRLAARSDAQWNDYRQRADRIPFGQPILVGHHSEGWDRRYRDRMIRKGEQSIETGRAAERVAERAQAAEGNQRHRENGATTERRIQKLEAEHKQLRRKLDGHTRTVYKATATHPARTETTTPATGPHRDRLEARLARVEEELVYWRQHLDHLTESGAYKRWGPDDFQRGDLVLAIGQWHKVKRVNAKTLTVPSIIGCSWTDTIPYDEVSGRKPGDGSPDAATDQQQTDA